MIARHEGRGSCYVRKIGLFSNILEMSRSHEAHRISSLALDVRWPRHEVADRRNSDTGTDLAVV